MPFKTGFIKGRQIVDGILIASEVAHSIRSRKIKGVMLKLDFAKAFDSVDLTFLFNCMEVMGFGPDWQRWIKAILSSMKASVLVNGSPTGEFQFHRGLRQRDPLSPPLFNLAGEFFSQLMFRAEGMGLIKGIHWMEGVIGLTHLQFADDTIIFLQPEEESFLHLKRILQCLQLVSGLKINMEKSALYYCKDHWMSKRKLALLIFRG